MISANDVLNTRIREQLSKARLFTLLTVIAIALAIGLTVARVATPWWYLHMEVTFMGASIEVNANAYLNEMSKCTVMMSSRRTLCCMNEECSM